MSRLLYIDWLRGVAVLFMILWHSIDAWTLQSGRDTLAFTLIRFAAGWAAPLFLMLAGVSVSLAAVLASPAEPAAQTQAGTFRNADGRSSSLPTCSGSSRFC